MDFKWNKRKFCDVEKKEDTDKHAPHVNKHE